MSVDKFGYSGSTRGSNVSTESKSTTDKFITLSRNLATSLSGDIMNGNLDILLNADTSRQFGVTDIAIGKQVLFLLGDTHNKMLNIFGRPMEISGFNGMKISCSKGDVCSLGSGNNTKSEFFQDISMNGKTITNLKVPTMELDAATKQYVDATDAALAAILETKADKIDLEAKIDESDVREAFTNVLLRITHNSNEMTLFQVKTQMDLNKKADFSALNHINELCYSLPNVANAYTNEKVTAAVSEITTMIPHYVKNSVGLVPTLYTAI